MAGGAQVWIAAAPEVVYAAVTDLARMGEWSPVNRGGEWVGPVAHAAVGATFVGRNRDPEGEWETLLTVVEAVAAVAVRERRLQAEVDATVAALQRAFEAV